MSGLEAALRVARDFDFSEPDPDLWQNFFGWVTGIFMQFYDWVNDEVQDPVTGLMVPRFDGAGLDAMNAWAGALNSLMSGLEAALRVARDFDFQQPDPATWQAFFTWVTDTFDQFYQEIVDRYGDMEDPATTFSPVAAWAGALGSLMGALEASLAVARDFSFEPPDAAQWDAFFDWTTTVFEQFRTEIEARYPEADAESFEPVAAWAGALGALMNGLQSAVSLASGFTFTPPGPDTWDAFFDWTTTVFEDFRAEIEARYPVDDPDQFAPVAAWAGAFSALMNGLQSAIGLVSSFQWTAPDPADWDDFFQWTLDVLEGFRDAIMSRYPQATAATWEPVVAWSNALGALMQALQSAAEMAGSFVFIPPTALGWDNFFDWVWAVFNEFRSRIEAEFPSNPAQAAATFAPVIAFSNAISAIFQSLQNALSFFMQMDGPGAAFWEFLGGITGNPDTSPFAQRMGYIIGAITQTMEAFRAWVLADAPQWNSNALILLQQVQLVIDILQDAIDLFDVASGITFPDTNTIQQFVNAVLQLFVTFSNGLANVAAGLGPNVNTVQTTLASLPGVVSSTIAPQWQSAGALLVQSLVEGMDDQIGTPTTTGTLRWVIQEVQNRIVSFRSWWVPNVGQGFWYDAGDALVDAFIAGMQSNLANVYNAAYAIGQTAGQGLNAGAGLTGGGSASSTMMFTDGGGWTPPTATGGTRTIEVVVRFENPPANVDRRALDELKRALVYEIRRGA